MPAESGDKGAFFKVFAEETVGTDEQLARM
jgi:hypothetical protein